jgi:hypothetical protein
MKPWPLTYSISLTISVSTATAMTRAQRVARDRRSGRDRFRLDLTFRTARLEMESVLTEIWGNYTVRPTHVYSYFSNYADYKANALSLQWPYVTEGEWDRLMAGTATLTLDGVRDIPDSDIDPESTGTV